MALLVIWIFEVILVCLLAVRLEGKSLKPLEPLNKGQQNERIKRGYNHYGGNDYSSSIQLSSPVLQYGDSGHQHTSSSLDANSHLNSAAAPAGVDPWSASGLSSGYEVWLEPSSDIHAPSTFDLTDIHASLHSSGDYIGSSDAISSDLYASSLGDHIANSVFSHAEPSSHLHTQIRSSSSYGTHTNTHADIHDHGISSISDNIDFNNVADLKSKHYTKSYGK